MNERTDSCVAVLVDDECVSLAELCRACRVDAEFVTEVIEYGVIEPLGEDPAAWRFTGASLRRVTRVVRLQRDLGLNLAGAALAVELLDELSDLRRRLR